MSEYGECYRIECSADKSSYKVHTHSGSAPLEVQCNNAGDKSSGFLYNVEFTCEDPAVICANYTSCPDDCHYR
jgi:hypothetical protein